MMRRRDHTRKGFNLIEAAIVLGVVGLVIGGIWVAAASIQENRRVNQAVSGALVYVENARRVFREFGTDPSCSATCVKVLNTVNGWNMDFYKGADGFSFPTGSTFVLDPWGQAFTSGVYLKLLGADYKRIEFRFNNLPPSRCIKLGAALLSRFNGNDVLEKIVFNNVLTITSFPYMPTTTECSAATNTNKIDLYLKF